MNFIAITAWVFLTFAILINILTIINTGMALPPVVVGLWVSILLWRRGPLGDLNLIYTPAAIVIAQTIIAAPVVTGLTAAALQQLNPRLRLQL